MPEVPNDPVAEFESLVMEQRIEDGISRAVLDVVPDLPTYRSFRVQKPNALPNHSFLRCKVGIKWGFPLVFLP